MANPLDLQELQPFIRNMEKEMPIHTDNTAKIKRSYSQGMPKNFMDYSAFVDNHFLNDNLAIIEEMNHRDAKHPIPRWFREYQIKHFAKFGILNKDRFFTSRMRDGYRKHFSADLTEIREIGSLPYSGTVLGFGSIGDTKVSPTFSDDFSTYADQTAADTAWPTSDTAKMRVNITNDNLDFNATRDSTDDRIYHDLVTVADTAWVLRFKMRLAAISGDPLFWIGLCNTNGVSSGTGDFIGVLFRPGDGATNRIQAVDGDGQTLQSLYNGALGSDANSSYSLATATDYWFQIRRLSSTTYDIKWFSDQFVTQLGSTLSGMCASTNQTLRYIRMYNYTGDSSGGTFQGTIDDMEFYDGITEV